MIVFLIWIPNHFASGHKIKLIMPTGLENPEKLLRRVPGLLKIILPEVVRMRTTTTVKLMKLSK